MRAWIVWDYVDESWFCAVPEDEAEPNLEGTLAEVPDELVARSLRAWKAIDEAAEEMAAVDRELRPYLETARLDPYEAREET